MPCCSVSRSRISFCLPCHVRDSPSITIWFIFTYPPVPTRTAARAPPPAPGTRADRDRRGAPPPGIPPGSAHRPLAPRLRRARAPSPGQTPAPGWRGLNGRDPTRGPHAHRATAHPIQSPPALRAVRASSRAAASIAADAAENATPSPPASCHRSTTRPRLPSRLRDTCRRQRAHRHGARFRSHTPPDPRGPCRTLTLYDCTTDRHTQHRHTALRSQRQRRHRGA
jgi:hypothetical protein